MGPFLEYRAKLDNKQRKRNGCNQKGRRAIKGGPAPATGLVVPLARPPVPLRGPFFVVQLTIGRVPLRL